MNVARILPSTVLKHARAVHDSVDPTKVGEPVFRLQCPRHIDDDAPPLKKAIWCAATDSPDDFVPLRRKARAQCRANQT